MSSASYSFKWDQSKLNQVKDNVMEAMVDLGMDTVYRAQGGAPVDSGALVESIRLATSGNQLLVLAGGTASGYNVPYAKFREYNNNLHPGTRYYMRNAFGWMEQNYLKYFRGITK